MVTHNPPYPSSPKGPKAPAKSDHLSPEQREAHDPHINNPYPANPSNPYPASSNRNPDGMSRSVAGPHDPNDPNRYNPDGTARTSPGRPGVAGSYDPNYYNPDGTLKSDADLPAASKRKNQPPQGYPTGPYERPPLPAEEAVPSNPIAENQSNPGPRKDPRKP